VKQWEIPTPDHWESWIEKEFLPQLEKQTLVLLYGDLGCGKTTFVRAVVKALGGDPSHVTSPTFTLLQVYHTPISLLNHMDFYRVKHAEEAEEAGLLDILEHEELTFVEWPQRLQEWGFSLPTHRHQATLTLHLGFHTHHDQGRHIRLELPPSTFHPAQ